jgi:hypothetical protein
MFQYVGKNCVVRSFIIKCHLLSWKQINLGEYHGKACGMHRENKALAQITLGKTKAMK